MTGNDRVNILLVDDQPGKLLTYEAILKDLDENLIKAGSAREALDHLLKTDVAVVLMDVCMPDLDGFEVATMIRQHPRYQKTAIILVSAVLLTDLDRLKGFEHGAVDYISVPVVPEILRAKVGVFVDLYRKTHQLERLNSELEERVAQRTADLESSMARLRESEAEHRLTLESALDCVIVMDHGGILVGFNTAAERIFGYRREEVIGRPLADVLIPPRLRDAHWRGLKRLLETGQSEIIGRRVEMSALRADGTEFPVELSISEIYSPTRSKAVLFTGFLRDITERKQMQGQLQKTTDELRQYTADLSEAARRKDEFLALLAHELRNPLAPMRNALQLLRLTSGEGETFRSASEMMERQVGHMVRLVDDLLDVSRISRGTIELRKERVELASIVHHAVEATRQSIESSKHVLTVKLPAEPIYLDADSGRLAQVFDNLLSNACKYTDPEGHIWLTAERRDGDVVVSVRDSGVGIPSHMLSKIFEMFTQVDQTLERSQGGLGIGLSLVQRLVEMHGGTVSAFSEGAGRGSEFVVRLPIMAEATVDSARSEPTVREPTAVKALRILVVDDNVDSARSMAWLLKLTGHETHTAHDGLEAVHSAQTLKPDAILLDIGLPKLNGYEAARRIREQPRGKRIVMIALTGWGQEEDRKKSKEAGFDAHMVKPVNPDTLTRLLAQLFAERQRT